MEERVKMVLVPNGVTGREEGWWYGTFRCPSCGWEKFSQIKQVWGSKKAPAPICEHILKPAEKEEI